MTYKEEIIGEDRLKRTISALEIARNAKIDDAGIARLITLTGFFEEPFYLASNPDVAQAGLEPAMHYVRYGYREGRLPASWLKDRAPAARPAAECETTLIEHIKGLGESLVPHKVEIARQGAFSSLFGLPMSVALHMSTMCNYRCSYCCDKALSIKDNFTSIGKWFTCIDNLASLNRPSYEFSFIGGEPTIYPHLRELISYIYAKLGKKIKKIQLLSNGSRNKYFYRFIESISADVDFVLNISLHTEFVIIDDIISIIERLSAKTFISFNLMFNPELFEKTRSLYDTLLELRKKYYFNLNIMALREPPQFVDLYRSYTPDHMNWRKESQDKFQHVANTSKLLPPYRPKWTDRFIQVNEGGKSKYITGGQRDVEYAEGLYNTQGMYCITGAQMLAVYEDGSLRGSLCGQGAYDINIFKKGALGSCEFIKMVCCKEKACGCAANDILMKFRDKVEAEQYFKTVVAAQKEFIKKGV